MFVRYWSLSSFFLLSDVCLFSFLFPYLLQTVKTDGLFIHSGSSTAVQEIIDAFDRGSPFFLFSIFFFFF